MLAASHASEAVLPPSDFQYFKAGDFPSALTEAMHDHI